MFDRIGYRILTGSAALSGLLIATGLATMRVSAQTEGEARTRGFQASNVGEDIRRDVAIAANREIGGFHTRCGSATAGAKGNIAFEAIEKHAPQISETARVFVNRRISAGLRETGLMPAEMGGLKHLVPFLLNDEQGRKQIEEAARRIKESPVLVSATIRRPAENLLHLQLTFIDRRPDCSLPRQQDFMFSLPDFKSHTALPSTDGDYYELGGLFHKGFEQAAPALKSAKQLLLAVDFGMAGRCIFKDRARRFFEVQYQSLRSEISSRIGHSPLPPLPAGTAAPLPPAEGDAEIRLGFRMSRQSQQVVVTSLELVVDGRQEAAVYGDAVIDPDWLRGCSPRREASAEPSSQPPPNKGTAQEAPAEAPAVFKDCDNCPEMIELPSGTFAMGSDPREVKEAFEDEGPVTIVTLQRFAVSRAEVSVAAFERFISAKGYYPTAMRVDDRNSWCAETESKQASRSSSRNHRTPGFGQNASHPVVCVSWHDARAYVAWLSEKTGKNYRLLSEAEFEYAQRAGAETPYWWGASADPTRAQYELGTGNYSQGRRGTVPAEQLGPNPWGFLHISGNAAEWVEDCWHPRHPSQPSNGTARTSPDCANRVIRGGGWTYSATMLRSSARDYARAGEAYVDVGFRIARDVTR